MRGLSGLLILVFLVGCVPTKIRPAGMMGSSIPYYTTGVSKHTCHWCKEKTSIFKVVNDKKIMCDDCFRTRYE